MVRGTLKEIYVQVKVDIMYIKYATGLTFRDKEETVEGHDHNVCF